MSKKRSEHPWSKAEIIGLHVRYIAGEYASELAKIRGKKVAYLLERFRHYKLPLRDKKKPVGKMRIPAEIVEAMYLDYVSGMTFADVERKHGRHHKTAREIFITRGWPVRKPNPNANRHHRPDGTWQAFPPKKEQEIEAMIQSATKLAVPAELKLEWRKWSIDRRGEFILRLRARIVDPLARPDLPYSSNLTPFDYSTKAAWDIIRAANKNLSSREWITKMDIISQGVIWNGNLWFWCRHESYYSEAVPWRPERPRRLLHRAIWESIHGPLGKNAVVRLIDGNPNNLDPSNFTLSDRNELCRENQATTLLTKSRQKISALLNRHNQPSNDHDTLPLLGRRHH